MKQRITSLAVVLCLLLSLTACGGGQNQAENGGQDAASAPMTEEAYQEQVDALSADIGEAMASLGALSVSDEETLREGVETIRAMIAPFRDFAAIANPPEVWAQAHSKVAAGCPLFADSLEGMCDSLVQVLDGEITSEAYTSAITEYTADLNEAAAQLTEGFGMIEG